MAKKSNRSKSTATSTAVKQTATSVEQADVTPSAAPAAETRLQKSQRSSRSQASEKLEDTYAYIVKDLRRVFILGGAMFTLLIILNIALGMLGR
jgi:hypothetical protein